MNFVLCLFLLSALVQSSELKFLTWNLFLLPPPINITYQEQRAKKITEYFSSKEYDVLLFQESFHRNSRYILKEGLSPTYPFTAISTKGRKFLSIMGSGLIIFSKHPMKVIDELVFDACTGGIVGDCRARKGALMVEISLPNNKVVQMINTHLQAWDNIEAIKVRKAQLRDILAMMKRQKRNGIPQILVGDINIDGHNEKEFSEGLNILNLNPVPLQGELQYTNGFHTPCYKNPGGDSRGQWLDHILHEGDLKISAQVLPIKGNLKVRGKTRNKLKVEKECTFSDHYAVEGVISFINESSITEDK